MIILLPTPKDFLNFHKRVSGGVRDQNLKSLAFHNYQINGYKKHFVYGSKTRTMQIKSDTYEISPQAAFKGLPPKHSGI